MQALAIDVLTPVPLRVVCTMEQWQLITTVTQPSLANQLGKVRLTLAEPDEVCESTNDPALLVYYRRIGARWMAAIVRRTSDEGFLLTAHAIDRVKGGARLWPR